MFQNFSRLHTKDSNSSICAQEQIGQPWSRYLPLLMFARVARPIHDPNWETGRVTLNRPDPCWILGLLKTGKWFLLVVGFSFLASFSRRLIFHPLHQPRRTGGNLGSFESQNNTSRESPEWLCTMQSTARKCKIGEQPRIEQGSERIAVTILNLQEYRKDQPIHTYS
jgi:hypothetical protein